MVCDPVKYFRRRQFVLGPEYVDYPGWATIEFDRGIRLTVHPDLQRTFTTVGESRALLLGYLIDPVSPSLNDQDILTRLMHDSPTLSTFVHDLNHLTGRFVLIMRSKAFVALFHDACGLRQVNYYRDGCGALWCASQPESLAEHLGLEPDADATRYRNMPEFRRSLEDFALIGERTPYRDVKYLLANHYLDLRSGLVRRYWPEPGSIGPPVKDHIASYCSILQGSIRAAAERFDLKQGISAGCDSRKSLAASRTVSNMITFFTEVTAATDRGDIDVPSRLLPSLGLRHHRLMVQPMSGDFKYYYERSATWARERHGHIAYSFMKRFGPECTVLNSNISEYAQVQYWLPNGQINGRGLAILKGLNHPVAVQDFQRWLDHALPSCEESGMNVLVLFQLELRSRWVANTFAERDIAHESFNPYVNRQIYSIELSVNERRRRGKRIDLPVKQIRHMWPDVLSHPINPERTTISKIRRVILRTIVHRALSPWVPIVEYLTYLRLRRRFRRTR